MTQQIGDIRQQMCDIGQRIWQRGYCAGNEGNHSVRLDEDRVLCTPTGMSKGFLEPDDLCVVDMAGEQVEKNLNGRMRTSEVLVHLAIYKRFPEVGAVVHSHPPHAVAFCLANMPLPEGLHPEAELFLGKTVFANYATPGGPEVPQSFMDKMTPLTNTILLANHGSISLGRELMEAYHRLEILDNYCKQLLFTRLLGSVNVLDNSQMTDLLKAKQRFGFDDERLSSEAASGVGAQNDQYLAGFDTRPASTASNSDTGEVADRPVSAAALEQAVKVITEQIKRIMA